MTTPASSPHDAWIKRIRKFQRVNLLIGIWNLIAAASQFGWWIHPIMAIVCFASILHGSRTITLINKLKALVFTCPKCGAVSFNPNDIENGYCGRCHDFTGNDS